MSKCKIVSLLTLLFICISLPDIVTAGVRKPGKQDSIVTAPSTGEEDIRPGVTPDPVYPEYTVYTPKVTSLRSVNALLAENGYAVFCLPTLQDFPVKLKDTVTDLTDGNNEQHKFALVYDGHFDNDVLLQNISSLGSSDVSSAKTSKKVYEQSNNSRCLNMLGYDLLLSKEEIPISIENGDLVFDYYITGVGNTELTANTCIMDLYKAMGVYEWDIRFAYGVDPNFDVNSSPILQELSVLTSNKGTNGVDATEAITWVAATRTNPEQYWDRCMRDAIFDGGQHKVPNSGSSGAYIGTEVSMSKVLGKGDTVTLGEFCEMARAVMTLYGEPVITELERNAALQLYGTELPKGSLSTEEYDAVMYLAAKGIIDPKDLNFNQKVTFADIEMLLLRIADEDSRLTIKSSVNMSTALSAAGYAKTGITISEDMDYTVIDSKTDGWYDFLIRKYPVNTYVVKDNTELSNPINNNAKGGTTGFKTGSGKNNDNMIPSASGVGLLVNGSYLRAPDLYSFYGLQEYGGVVYYHFKVNLQSGYSKFDNITMGYDTSNGDFTLVSGETVTLPDMYGGVYTMEGSKWVRESFTNANFTTEFVDKDNYRGNLKKHLSANTTIVAVTVPSGFLKESVLKNQYQRDGAAHNMDFSKLMNEGKVKESGRISRDVTFNSFEFSSDSDDYIRIEFTTPDKKLVTETNFFKYLADDESKAKIGQCEGYYRASDNSLLVSYNYLKKKGLASSLEKLKDDSGYTLVAGEYKTNITIFTKDTTNYIMVGDTIFGNPEGETLLEVGENDVYINYRACLGWASDFIVVPVGDGNVMALTPKDFGNGNKAWKVEKSTDRITTFFPKSSTNTLHLKIKKGNRTKGNGIALTGSYALAPYCVVMADDNGCDYLFVWHQKGVHIDGENYDLNEEDEKEARDMFKKWTGMEIEQNDSYALKLIVLKRNNTDDQVPGFKFVSMTKKTKTMGQQKAVYGYVYKPPTYENVNDALKDYARGLYADHSTAIKLPLPFFKYKGVIYDANINTCTDSEGNPQLRLGMMPGRFCDTLWTNSDQVVYLDDLGAQRVTRSSDYDTNSFIIYTAPVAMFSVLKCNGTKVISDIDSGAIYFGTSRVKVVDDKVVSQSGCETSYSIEDEAVCTYLGVGETSVYAVCDESGNAFSSIGDILQSAESSVEALFNDPTSVVDWSAYKFSRLVKNLDAWSTVVLIFVLNIMPRVGVLLFFCLMLLCCIKNVRPWQLFCERTFDVYKFLTFQHMDVHTINVKRVLIISLICTALFIIIMDGQFFNFMIWIAKLFIAYTQR